MKQKCNRLSEHLSDHQYRALRHMYLHVASLLCITSDSLILTLISCNGINSQHV